MRPSPPPDTINFREFCVGLSAVSRGTLRERIALSFRMFDTEHEGRVTPAEMKRMLKLLNKAADEIDLIHHPVSLRESQVRRMGQEEQISRWVDLAFAKYDKDGSGSLSLDEWCAAVLDSPVLKALQERMSLQKQ